MKELLSGRQLLSHDSQIENFTEKELMAFGNCQKVKAIEKKGTNFRCLRCNNRTEFEKIRDTEDYYCLNCLQLGRVSTLDDLYRFNSVVNEVEKERSSYLTWEGTLSIEQQRASKALVDSLQVVDKVHIIQAVTGAGKTEMIFSVIDKVLTLNGRVALVSPRVDVCLELAPRIQSAFASIDVLTLHGRMSESYRYSRLIIATNHQLLKFYHAFDLIIVDEVDAFPLAGDDGLHFAVKQALKEKGKLIYLTATPDQFLDQKIKRKEAEVTVLPARFHRYPLPEPKFKWLGNWREQINQRKKGHLLQEIQQFLGIEGVKLIFMPDIKLAISLFEWLKSEFPQCRLEVVHAKDPHRIQKVQSLRTGEYEVLISTTILERGVTFANCHVFIIGAEDRSYGTSALIQMSGRVGRKADFPKGTLIYGHFGLSLQMVKAKKNICKMNQLARNRRLLNE